MITEPTVFILGAGASAPYGFPVGSKLRKDILTIPIDHNIDRAKLSRSHPSYSKVWDYILERYKEDNVKNFFEDLRRSGFSSVDAFLENRDEYIDLGKTIISLELIKYEDENRLYVEDEGAWYQYLYHNFLRAPFAKFSENNVVFLTFNYDRSLEQFFLNAIMSDYGKTDVEAIKLLESIPIIHLHGKLGNLPAESNNNSRNYHGGITPKNLDICRKGIKIIHEGIDEDEQFQKAHKFIKGARKIWFLGFGYDITNLKRLKLPELINNGTQSLYGTTYKMEYGEVINKVHSALQAKIDLNNIIDKSGHDSLLYLRYFSNHIK